MSSIVRLGAGAAFALLGLSAGVAHSGVIYQWRDPVGGYWDGNGDITNITLKNNTK